MKIKFCSPLSFVGIAMALTLFLAPLTGRAATTILNVSYDPTREFYREFNTAFAKHWKAIGNGDVVIRQSHGGSGSQARAVIDGLQADVVTLALAADIDAIATHAQLLPTNWQSRLPNNSAPYVSTLAIIVRKGNPKNITSWGDLARPGIEVITPNPKTSGVARWNYLALWGFALQQELGPDCAAKLHDPAAAAEVEKAQQKARDFVTRVFKNVPILDRGARAATNTFVQRHIGDVLINWENEALLSKNDLDAAGIEIIIPTVNILAEPVVALVDRHVDRKNIRPAAQAYLEFLYSDVGQHLAAKHYYRPTNPAIAAQYATRFPAVNMFTVTDYFESWEKVNQIHFNDGGEFDKMYTP